MQKYIKRIFYVLLASLTIANSGFAMTLSRIVEIGEVGFPVQAPYHGFIIRGESYNTGIPYLEDTKYSCSKEPLKTYVKGIARFGVGENALYCDYNLNTSAERPQP